MPPANPRRARGAFKAEQLLLRLGDELRTARRSAGLSLGAVAHGAGISASQLSRLERAQVKTASVRVFALCFAVLGHTLTVRAYPDGSPLRDVAHARLIQRFAKLLPPTVRLRTEVPLRRPGELRAWDGELCAADDCCKLEAETVIADAQALDRRIALKMEEDGVDRAILLVADTRRNREALRQSGQLLHLRFPLTSGAMLAELQEGRILPSSGIVIL